MFAYGLWLECFDTSLVNKASIRKLKVLVDLYSQNCKWTAFVHLMTSYEVECRVPVRTIEQDKSTGVVKYDIDMVRMSRIIGYCSRRWFYSPNGSIFTVFPSLGSVRTNSRLQPILVTNSENKQ